MQRTKTPRRHKNIGRNKIGRQSSGYPKTVTAGNGKTYSHHVIVRENGAYRITAEDKWGHKNTVETNVSVVDKNTAENHAKRRKQRGCKKTKRLRTRLAVRLKESVVATDSQSGANAPLGDKELKT